MNKSPHPTRLRALVLVDAIAVQLPRFSSGLDHLVVGPPWPPWRAARRGQRRIPSENRRERCPLGRPASGPRKRRLAIKAAAIDEAERVTRSNCAMAFTSAGSVGN
jgi:hypothetical protein